MAKPKNPEVILAVVRLAAACQRSRPAWARPAGLIPAAWSQSQNAWPQVNARAAYRAEPVIRVPSGAARSRGSRENAAYRRSTPRCGCPVRDSSR